ncbi:MAG: ABC transporter ATP-binding protein [Bdellovibrionota bacterium]
MQVEFQNVYKKYGNFTAVNNLNLTIKDGALHFLLGPSGCGKTTTLRMLAGLEPISEGKILFDGKDVTNLPAAERGIGMVFQNYALWPHMTVYKNIEYGLKLRKLGKGEVASRIKEVLGFTQLTQFKDRLPGQLSGGQQQRVALARALAIRPNVLLLDEPLSNLDAKLRLEMRDNISRIHKQTGITTLYVTHDQKEALSMGSHITVMHAGNEIQTGTPRELYLKPKTPFLSGFIGETNIIAGKIVQKENNGQLLVKTEIGEFTSLVSMGEFSVGDSVSVSIRPESIMVKYPNQEIDTVDNKFELELDHLTYLGESEQLKLKSTGGTSLKATVFNAPEDHFNDGDSVTIFVPKEQVLILPPNTDMGPGT